MSAKREREYRRQYMKRYYQTHKDYWRNYYHQRKRSTAKSKGAYRNRIHYLERISAAWSETHLAKSPLSRLLRRLGATATLRFDSSSRGSPKTDKKSSMNPPTFNSILHEILSKEGFVTLQFPNHDSGASPSQDSPMPQVLALKDDRRCIIEIVTSPVKAFTKKRAEYLRSFLSFFEARYFLCFVKPDLSRYQVMELEPSKIRSLTLGLKAIAAMKPTPTLT